MFQIKSQSQSSSQSILYNQYFLQYMIQSLQFPVTCGKRQFNLELTPKFLRLTTDQILITFRISLNLIITWLLNGDQIVGFQVGNLSIEGQPNDMRNLKQNLGASVTFTGISLFYTLKQTIFVNKNDATKVSQLTSNNNNQVYACKSYKKQNRSLAQIHNEINILLRLQGQSSVPIIYEVYESNNRVYLIMEYLQKGFDDGFLDEEMKIVTYAVQTLEQNSVAHKNIKRSHIMFDEDNKLKVIGFGNAVCDHISNNEFELDIFQIGTTLYKFYQKKQQEKEELPYIPDNGTDLLCFLLKQQQNCNLELALSHSYFGSLRGDGIQRTIQSMHPKFKKQIANHDLKYHNDSLIYPSKKHFLLPEDSSTSLHNLFQYPNF